MSVWPDSSLRGSVPLQGHLFWNASPNLHQPPTSASPVPLHGSCHARSGLGTALRLINSSTDCWKSCGEGERHTLSRLQLREVGSFCQHLLLNDFLLSKQYEKNPNAPIILPIFKANVWQGHIIIPPAQLHCTLLWASKSLLWIYLATAWTPPHLYEVV